MTVEILEPKLEALIQERMASGRYASIDAMLMDAFGIRTRSAEEYDAILDSPTHPNTGTGLDLMWVMQHMPYRDQVELEPPRYRMPDRETRAISTDCP